MASKNDDGFTSSGLSGLRLRLSTYWSARNCNLSNRDLSFIAFCDELRAYVEEHKLFPQKHSRLSHKIKYTRKKINEGTLEDWKREMFEAIANSRDLTIHTGGRKKGNSDTQGSECL